MVHQETREMTGNRVNRVLLDQLESLVPLDHLANGGLLDLQGLRDDKERREPRESLVWRVPKERLVLLVPKVLLENLALRVSEVSPAQLVNKVFLVPQGQTDLLDLWVLQAYQA